MSSEGPGEDLVGSRMSGRLSYSVCKSCGHRHERSDDFGWDAKATVISWITACEVEGCGCVASGSDYNGPTYNLDDYDPAAPTDDHNDCSNTANYCAAQNRPGPCYIIRSYAGRSGGLGDDGPVRRRRTRRSDLRLLRHLPADLAGVWRWAVRARRGSSDPGRAGGDWDAYRGASAR